MLVINLTTNETTSSFTYDGDISLKSRTSPDDDPDGHVNISHYLNVTNYSAGAWIYINISYDADDVSGIYDADPKETSNANLFDVINLNDLENIFERIRASSASDASGVMEGKIKSIAMAKDFIEAGLEVSILSMMELGNLKALLNGDTSNSTQFIVK